MWQRIAHWILRIGGWTLVGELPALNKAVFIAAPHTSNWDGFWLMVYKVALDVQVHFLAKHSLFWWPLGAILGAMGAMPVDRSVSTSTVQQLVNAFAENDRFWFALSPEGTRKWQPYWKTGFYEIAIATNVPIVLAFIDYRDRKLGIGISLLPPRNIDQDLPAFRDFYAPFQGRIIANKGPVEFPPDYRPSGTLD